VSSCYILPLLLSDSFTKAAVNDQTIDLRYSAVGSKQTNKQTNSNWHITFPKAQVTKITQKMFVE